MGFEFLEHTADIRLRAWGETKEELFANAAMGMMTFIFGEAALKTTADRTEVLAIQSTDQDALLVDWLSKLLFKAVTEYRATVGVMIGDLTESKLTAAISTAKAKAIEDIKAVTRYDLRIAQLENRYEATITFDI